MEFFKQAHATYYCRYHLVFNTKYRRRILKPGVLSYCKILMRRITRIFPDVAILEINGEEDHVHLFVSIPPKYSVADIVGKLKGGSAHAMRRKFEFVQKVYYGADGLWSDGYFVSSVGVNEQIIRRYIEAQGREDGGQATLAL
jgi:putative transposase